MTSSGAEDHLITGELNRDLAETEMVRAAVMEFLKMEQSLQAAAEHLRAAEDIRRGSGDEAGATGSGASEVAPELSVLATRLALPG
jgi:hypothetical protein